MGFPSEHPHPACSESSSPHPCPHQHRLSSPLHFCPPWSINSMRAKARGTWRGHSTFEWTLNPTKGRRGGKFSSAQTSPLQLQENECENTMQIDIIVCKYECWFCAYFPSRFSHPDLWFSSQKSVWDCASGSLWMENWKKDDFKLQFHQNLVKLKNWAAQSLLTTPLFLHKDIDFIKACWTYVHIREAAPDFTTTVLVGIAVAVAYILVYIWEKRS